MKLVLGAVTIFLFFVFIGGYIIALMTEPEVW